MAKAVAEQEQEATTHETKRRKRRGIDGSDAPLEPAPVLRDTADNDIKAKVQRLTKALLSAGLPAYRLRMGEMRVAVQNVSEMVAHLELNHRASCRMKAFEAMLKPLFLLLRRAKKQITMDTEIVRSFLSDALQSLGPFELEQQSKLAQISREGHVFETIVANLVRELASEAQEPGGQGTNVVKQKKKRSRLTFTHRKRSRTHGRDQRGRHQKEDQRDVASESRAAQVCETVTAVVGLAAETTREDVDKPGAVEFVPIGPELIAIANKMLAPSERRLTMCLCGLPRKKCHPGLSDSAHVALPPSRELGRYVANRELWRVELLKESRNGDRNFWHVALRGLVARGRMLQDAETAKRSLYYYLINVQHVLDRGSITTESKRGAKTFAEVIEVFEMMVEPLSAQAKNSKAVDEIRMQFYDAIRVCIASREPWRSQTTGLRQLSSMVESVIAGILFESRRFAEVDVQMERLQQEREMFEQEPAFLWNWLFLQRTKMQEDKQVLLPDGHQVEPIQMVEVVQLATHLHIAQMRRPTAKQIQELVWWCWRADYPRFAIELLLSLWDRFQEPFSLIELIVMLLLDFAKALSECQERRQRPVNILNRLLCWVRTKLAVLAPQLFCMGGGIVELRQVLQAAGSPFAFISLRTQLECCAECIERWPLEATAWCLLGQTLCNHREGIDETLSSVRAVWTPRCSLWWMLFYASPLPKKLTGASLCILRHIALLFVHFPHIRGEQLQQLLLRLASSRSSSTSKKTEDAEESTALSGAGAAGGAHQHLL